MLKEKNEIDKNCESKESKRILRKKKKMNVRKKWVRWKKTKWHLMKVKYKSEILNSKYKMTKLKFLQ